MRAGVNGEPLCRMRIRPGESGDDHASRHRPQSHGLRHARRGPGSGATRVPAPEGGHSAPGRNGGTGRADRGGSTARSRGRDWPDRHCHHRRARHCPGGDGPRRADDHDPDLPAGRAAGNSGPHRCYPARQTHYLGTGPRVNRPPDKG